MEFMREVQVKCGTFTPNAFSLTGLSESCGGGHWGLRFCGFGPFLPRFFRVLDFEARFFGFLQHRGLRLLVLIVGGLRFADVVHGFSVAL